MQKYKFSFKGQNIYVGIDARSEVFDFFVKRSITCPRDLPEAADFRFSILIFGELAPIPRCPHDWSHLEANDLVA